MYLAVDSSWPIELTSHILEWAEGAPEDANVIAFVDMAFDHARPQPFKWPHESVSLYAGDELRALSPTLLALRSHAARGRHDKEELRRDLVNLLHHCQGRPMLSFVQSRLGPRDLAAAWHPVRWVSTADDQRFLLRLADTRVLTVLPDCLSALNWARVCQPLHAWQVVDRQGIGRSLPMPLQDQLTDPAASIGRPFQIDDDELGRLLEAAQPDALIHALSCDVPDVLPSTPDRARVHAWVSAACELARQQDLDGSTDQLLLAAAVCATGGKLLAHPGLPGLLASHRGGQGDLSDALSALLPEDEGTTA